MYVRAMSTDSLRMRIAGETYVQTIISTMLFLFKCDDIKFKFESFLKHTIVHYQGLILFINPMLSTVFFSNVHLFFRSASIFF